MIKGMLCWPLLKRGMSPHRFGRKCENRLRQSSAVSRIKWRTVTDAHVKFKGPCRGRDARSAPAPAGWLEDEFCPNPIIGYIQQALTRDLRMLVSNLVSETGRPSFGHGVPFMRT